MCQPTPTLVLLLLLPFAAPECVLTPGSKNVVASRLEGTWVSDIELTERLNPDHVSNSTTTPRPKPSNYTIRFRNSSEVLDILPKEDCASLHSRSGNGNIYMAGFMTHDTNEERSKTYPMVAFNIIAMMWLVMIFLMMMMMMEIMTTLMRQVVTTLRGNPKIVFWRKDMTDTESFHVMLATSKDKNQDILFIGTDTSIAPYSALKRL